MTDIEEEYEAIIQILRDKLAKPEDTEQRKLDAEISTLDQQLASYEGIHA